MGSVVRLSKKFKAHCSISLTVTREVPKLAHVTQFTPTHGFFYVPYTGRLNRQFMYQI